MFSEGQEIAIIVAVSWTVARLYALRVEQADQLRAALLPAVIIGGAAFGFFQFSPPWAVLAGAVAGAAISVPFTELSTGGTLRCGFVTIVSAAVAVALLIWLRSAVPN